MIIPHSLLLGVTAQRGFEARWKKQSYAMGGYEKWRRPPVALAHTEHTHAAHMRYTNISEIDAESCCDTNGQAHAAIIEAEQQTVATNLLRKFISERDPVAQRKG